MQKPDLRIAPEFIDPLSWPELTEEQQEALLEDIRTKRLIVVATYQQIQAEKEKVRGEKLEAQMEKVAVRIAKVVDQLDAHFEKLEELINKYRGLRLELPSV